MTEGRHVFINCPFDRAYRRLLRALLFAVHDCGFRARSALAKRYRSYRADLPTLCAQLRLDSRRLTFHDDLSLVTAWLGENPWSPQP